MYDETILPVRSKFRVPSRSQARIYFVNDKAKDSLVFLKWIELVLSLLCACFIVIVVNITDIGKIDKILIISANFSSIIIILAEITYAYIKRSLPLIAQALTCGTNLFMFIITTSLIYRMNNNHELIKALFFLNGFAAVSFLVDLICRVIISAYLYQTTRAKSMVDVAVSAFFPPSSSGNKTKSPPHRSILTTTPITYGGTFPIGKDQPPFLAEERIPPNDGCQTPEKGTRSRSVQTPFHGDARGLPGFNFPGPVYSAERLPKSKFVQTFLDYDEKGTSTAHLLHAEEDRPKKSPWTCSTPTTSRKMEARKQASMSTPITYSGTFAVNKELVPITPVGLTGSSPKGSPRNVFITERSYRKTTNSKSEGSSPPVRAESTFLELERLDQISEEKTSQMSSEDCSLKKSNCTFFDSSILPGSVIEEDDQIDRRTFNYFVR